MVAVLNDIPQRQVPYRPAPALRLVSAGQTGATAPRRRPSLAVRRRRLFVAVLAVTAVVAGMVMLAAFALQAALGDGRGGPLTTAAASRGASAVQVTGAVPASARFWVVKPGDTLWSIALAVHPHGDIRPTVDRLSAQVHDQPLAVGQRIALP